MTFFRRDASDNPDRHTVVGNAQLLSHNFALDGGLYKCFDVGPMMNDLHLFRGNPALEQRFAHGVGNRDHARK